MPQLKHWDSHRDLLIPGDTQITLVLCCEHWVSLCKSAIQEHAAFFVALSGGSTPKALFERLTAPPYNTRIDWSKVHLFWSDERAVPPDHPDSNYRMAMEAGLSSMGIPENQIHRMHAETQIEDNARLYEKTIKQVLKDHSFDLVMLGVGEDGHIASLFPGTQALHAPEERSVIANYLPDKKIWRMTLTFSCINRARHSVVYVLGASKKSILKLLLASDDGRFPAQRVGTPGRPSLWIADEAAASEIIHS
jgi:6-phosphogluconolactonase